MANCKKSRPSAVTAARSFLSKTSFREAENAQVSIYPTKKAQRFADSGSAPVAESTRGSFQAQEGSPLANADLQTTRRINPYRPTEAANASRATLPALQRAKGVDLVDRCRRVLAPLTI